MHRDPRKLLLSLALLALGGCDLKRELVGETLTGPGPDGASTTSGLTGGDATDGDDSMTTSPTTGAPDGTPCEFGPPESFEEGTPPMPDAPTNYGGGRMLSPGPDCAGGVCLYAADVQPPNCDDDATCAGDERLSGSCGEFQCDVDPTWAEAHTTCTRTCEAATDCPAIPGCTGGPVCTVVSRLGSLCCQKVCACRDELSESTSQELEMDCDAGKYCQ